MPKPEELARTPSGEPTVDVLKQAYIRAVFLNPFEPNDFNDRNPSRANLAYSRIAKIPFAPYWSGRFQEFRDEYNGNPAGLFAQNIFLAAENKDGIELRATVAEELARSFADEILEARIESPLLDDATLDEQHLSPLAQFLVERLAELEGTGGVKLFDDGKRDISTSWITFTHVLASANPAMHDFILTEVTGAYAKADVETKREMELWEGMMGGYNIWDRDNEIRRVIATSLAHFPDVIISLQAPTQEQIATHGELPIPDRPQLSEPKN